MDPLSLHFSISDVDDAADPKYYGFLKSNGNWYIQKEDVANKNFRYAFGWSGYSTAWTNRASLNYDYYNTVFGLC